jgi:NADPH-dependent 2,4-dienoyl-CoA reductase/sulfur reductase-like enzyme
MTKVGINIQLNQAVKGFKGNDQGEVTHVITDKGEYKADMVIMAIGMRPQTSIIDAEKVRNGAIKVDNRQRSIKYKDTYVVGDCAAMKHAATGEYVNIALATNAVKTGLVAALDLLEQGIDFPGLTGTNAINVFGFNYSSTGYSVNGAKLCGIEVKSEYLNT